MTLNTRVQQAIEQDKISGRLWLYSNYHCNLSCRYCLTESNPSVPSRAFSQEQMIDFANQAVQLGFTSIAITGGEPFLLPYMTSTVKALSALLPVTVLTNGTLFNKQRRQELQSLVGHDVRIQISLDHHEAQQNDSQRGNNNFNTVVQVVPILIKMGLRVRIATTVEKQSPEEQAKLEQLVQSLGVPKEDHLIRKIVTRGRAVTEELGVQASAQQLMPELTISKVGAFWSPFGPTFNKGRLQTDLLISKTTTPLTKPLSLLLDYLGQFQRNPEDTEGFV